MLLGLFYPERSVVVGAIQEGLFPLNEQPHPTAIYRKANNGHLLRPHCHFIA